MYDAQVVFFDLPFLELLIQDPQCFRRFGGYHNAAGIPIDAVDQRGCKARLPGRIVSPFFIEIPLYAKQEGVAVFLFVRMHQQAGFFVQQQQIVVFIDNIQLPGCRQKVINRRRFFQKFVFQIQGKHITGLQTC